MRTAWALCLLLLGAGTAVAAAPQKLCPDAIMVVDDTTDDDGVLNMTLTINGRATKFEYGGSLATGTGISVWAPVDGGENATDDGRSITWNGRTYRRCA